MKNRLIQFVLCAFVCFCPLLGAKDFKYSLDDAIGYRDFDTVSQIIESDPEQIQFDVPANEYSTDFSTVQEYIYDRSGITIPSSTTDYNTLEKVIHYGAPLSIIKTLVSLGADVNSKHITYGGTSHGDNAEYSLLIRTPLFEALDSRWRDFERGAVVQFLIDNGADIDHVSWKGNYFQSRGFVFISGTWKTLDQYEHEHSPSYD